MMPKHDEPLSNFAFKLNLRRYTWVPKKDHAAVVRELAELKKKNRVEPGAAERERALTPRPDWKRLNPLNKVGRCRFTPGSPQVHPRFTPGSPQVHLRFTPGSPQVHPRFTTVSPQVHPRFTPGSSQVHPSFTQGTP